MCIPNDSLIYLFDLYLWDHTCIFIFLSKTQYLTSLLLNVYLGLYKPNIFFRILYLIYSRTFQKDGITFDLLHGEVEVSMFTLDNFVPYKYVVYNKDRSNDLEYEYLYTTLERDYRMNRKLFVPKNRGSCMGLIIKILSFISLND